MLHWSWVVCVVLLDVAWDDSLLAGKLLSTCTIACVLGVDIEFTMVALIFFLRCMKVKIESEQEFQFQRVHLGGWNSTDLGVVDIVVIKVIQELHRHDHTATENCRQ